MQERMWINHNVGDGAHHVASYALLLLRLQILRVKMFYGVFFFFNASQKKKIALFFAINNK